MNGKFRKISKKDLLIGLDRIINDGRKLAALTRKGEKVLYDYVTKSDEILMQYIPTVLSPKKFFLPQDEVILEYTTKGKVTAKIEAESMVLFGIKPCDLHGIKILDEAFAESNGDPNYLAKREKSLIIGLDCSRLCDEKAFCYKVNAQNITTGCDFMLHNTGIDFAVTVYTEKGAEQLDKYFQTEIKSENILDDFNQAKAAAFSKFGTFKQLKQLPEIFENNKNHSVWQTEGDKCLSCGSCILVCPTCYCFDVADEMALNLKKGERIRRWDACMLNSFAVVAGNDNFREEPKDRLKHRINRKFNYLMKKHGESVCVGCGRCVRACLVNISPKTIAETITGELSTGG
ncbi:MAG: hypothetical protein GY730_11185 [bacterium]|nr:hypothetical protein [bacterium]